MRNLIKISLGFLLAVLIFIAVFIFADRILETNNSQNIVNSIEKLLGINQQESIVDNAPLEITLNVDENEVIDTYENFVSIGILSNKEIEVDNAEKYKLDAVNTDKELKEYALEISQIGNGQGIARFKLSDKVGNQKLFSISINKVSFNIPFSDNKIEEWPNTKYIFEGDHLLAPMSKNNRLFSTYSPTDLVNLKNNYINMFVNQEDFELRKDAADYLDLMLNSLRRETGKNIVIASAYRSYNNQVQTYTGWLKAVGQAEADNISARPGYSEHQLGTVVDFFSEDSGFDFTSKFDETIAGKWLRENAYKYGYVQTYPKGSENLTNYAYEAWHWRYIGVDAAKEIKEKYTSYPEWILGS